MQAHLSAPSLESRINHFARLRWMCAMCAQMYTALHFLKRARHVRTEIAVSPWANVTYRRAERCQLPDLLLNAPQHTPWLQ